MDYVKRFKILLSAPSDVSSELEKVEHGIQLFNRTTGAVQDMLVDCKHWYTSSHPEAGDRPQELLNNQFIRDCDAAIVIFGARFGTPTGKFDSGTEEEIEEMLQAGKAVFLYFSEVPKDLDTIDLEQFGKVKAFKEKYSRHGLYGTFKSLEEIEKKVHADLSLFFLKNPDIDMSTYNKQVAVIESEFELSAHRAESTDRKHSALYGFDHEKVQKVIESFEAIIRQKVLAVIELTPPEQPNHTREQSAHGEASRPAGTSQALDIIKRFNQINTLSGGPVQIESKVQSSVSDFCENRLNISIPEGFFNLGNLREDRLMVRVLPLDSGPHYSGDENSQRKFSLICELDREIRRVLGINMWLSQLNTIYIFQPILKNTGGHFDEDITVDLFFPMDIVFSPTELVTPNFECSEFITEQLLPFVFQPKKNFEIEPYADYPKRTPIPYIPPSIFTNSHESVAKECDEKYQKWIKSHFRYEIHEARDQQVVSCSFSYLRQHTAIFFPAPILLKRADGEIGYRIRSKHSSKISSGKLALN